MDCIFCRIVNGEIPCTKVYEDENVLCFNDINPEAPVHVVMIPKKHISNLNEASPEDFKLIEHIFMAAQKICRDLNIDEDGYRIITNCGEYGGQTVQHIHFHLLGGRRMKWPPG